MQGGSNLKKIKKIVVTGGAGYIGSVLISFLLKNFDDNSRFGENELEEIVIVDNLLFNQTSIIHLFSDKRIRFIYADVRDLDLYSDELLTAQVILPLAAVVGYFIGEKDKRLTWDTNYSAIRKMLNFLYDFCEKRNIEKPLIIFPTTNSGYGNTDGSLICDEETLLKPISTYGKSKVSAEKDIIDFGGVALRLATVFGVSPKMRLDLLVNDFVFKAVTDKSIVLFESNFKRNYVHILDVCRAFIFAIENFELMKGQSFNIGLSEANLSKLELCKIIKEKIPDFSIMVEDGLARDPDKRNYIVSNKKIESLGFFTKYDLNAGIDELIKVSKYISNLNKQFRNY